MLALAGAKEIQYINNPADKSLALCYLLKIIKLVARAGTKVSHKLDLNLAEMKFIHLYFLHILRTFSGDRCENSEREKAEKK